jgi:hypothetical protein
MRKNVKAKINLEELATGLNRHKFSKVSALAYLLSEVIWMTFENVCPSRRVILMSSIRTHTHTLHTHTHTHRSTFYILMILSWS